MQDNFHVDVKGEDRVSTLTYEEYCKLLTLSIRAIELAIVEEFPDGDDRAAVRDIVETVLVRICGRGVESDDYSKYRRKCDALKRRASDFLDNLAGVDEVYKRQLDVVVELADALYEKYPVVVVISGVWGARSRAWVADQR